MASLLVVNFFEILRETFKILIKNCKIFASIALFTLLINSIGYLCNLYSITPLVTDLFIEVSQLNNTKPDTPEYTQIITQITKDIKYIVWYEFLYIIINSAFIMLSTIATILATAITYSKKEKGLSLKDLVYKTIKSWPRTFYTWLYISFFSFVYIFVFGVIILIIAMTTQNPSKLIFVSIPIGIFAMVLYMYLSVTWMLAIVVSAIEKVKGIEALQKAGEIIRGMRLQGFMVNCLLNIVTFVMQLGIQLIPLNTISLIVARGLIVLYLTSLASMYLFAAFTVIYFRCKKNHGESVEIEGNWYSRIPSTPPLVDDNLP